MSLARAAFRDFATATSCRALLSRTTLSTRSGAFVSAARRLHASHHARSESAPEPQPSQSFKDKQAIGPFNLRAGALFVATGVGLYFYFRSEKEKVQQKKRQELADAKVGKPKVGGPFALKDQDGNTFTDKDLLGKFSLVYFGFTNCPDICPEELDKMSLVVEQLSQEFGQGAVLPVFVTCDPARDSQSAIKTYLKDFHPSMVGLTGTYDQIKAACKSYRVYFSTPPNAKATDDYLVDHSIFFYLMDPEGHFVDAFGRVFTKEDVLVKCRKYLTEWNNGKRWAQPS